MSVTVSLVLYQNSPEEVKKVIDCILASRRVSKLVVIDNSPDETLRHVMGGDILYKWMGENLGFGAGHNRALKEVSLDQGRYHLIVNPDVHFSPGVIERLEEAMEANPQWGAIMPRVLYVDGRIQYLCKLLPTPLNWIVRRFCPVRALVDKLDWEFELRGTGYDRVMNIPYLSGCFLMLRRSLLEKIGFFDERYFMYCEDVDLSRRVHLVSESVYFPHVSIVHGFRKGSHHNWRLLWIAVVSSIRYFNKWGWFVDSERQRVNSRVLREYLGSGGAK